MAQGFRYAKVEDALALFDRVRYTFSDQPQVYNRFLDIMRDVRNGLISPNDIIQPVADLFRGYPELIADFKQFCPFETEIVPQRKNILNSVFEEDIEVPECHPQDCKQLSLEASVYHQVSIGNSDHLAELEDQFRKNEAHCADLFQKEVEYDFHNRSEMHQEFLQIMKEFYPHGIESPGAIERIRQLLQKRPELITFFNGFLLPEYTIKVHPNKEIVIVPKKSSGGDIC